MVEMAIGKYPIPPPSPRDMAQIFGPNAVEEHLEAAKAGLPLPGRNKQSLCWHSRCCVDTECNGVEDGKLIW